MDAATRAELNALLLRAYGPAADIDADPVAIARLAQLEELAHPARPETADIEPAASAASAAPSATASVAPTAAAATAHPTAAPMVAARSRRRPATALLGVAVIAVVTIVAAVVANPQQDDAVAGEVDMAVPVLIEASTGDYVDLSDGLDTPVFPVRTDMDWVQPLGEHYGWSLWIGGAAGKRTDRHCLLLTGGGGTRARCVSERARERGELVVSLPYERIAPEDRPPGMTADQIVRFAWSTGAFVTIQLRPGGD